MTALSVRLPRSDTSTSSVSPSITGMLMSLITTSIEASRPELVERLLAVQREQELELAAANLLPELLPDQRLEIRLVVNDKDLDGHAIWEA